eukprot:CAMPEP_0184864508 /NCGR_PEP_ID=MMETSP0580-20130426/15231_1 /TAXON_ID=1118495 /ORGANISM="Dactyliosolen fragilissimus" /LENGTH=265 /DNA_ID=CAMNT_0027363337 /DNA_START=83 /DNA_END=877 /DNA_ORIENTATION=+
MGKRRILIKNLFVGSIFLKFAFAFDIYNSNQLRGVVLISSSSYNRVSISNSKTVLNGIDFESLDEECDLYSSSSSGSENIKMNDFAVTSDTAAESQFNFLEFSIGEKDMTLEERQAASFPRSELECLPLPLPDPQITPEDVVNLCMDFLMTVDDRYPNAGLEVCYNFSSDSCQAANGGSLESFLHKFNPTFESMTNPLKWKVLSVGPEIIGTPTRGAMKTILIMVRPRDQERFGKQRKFLWTLQKERRPPRQNCWLVHECIFLDN